MNQEFRSSSSSSYNRLKCKCIIIFVFFTAINFEISPILYMTKQAKIDEH